MIFHDPVKHCRYLKQVLSQKASNIGFFISAGCPLSVRMPEGKWPLIPDVMGLTTYLEGKLNEKNIKYDNLVAELKKDGVDEPNIEEILSFVRTLKDVAKGGDVRGLSKADLELIEKNICDEISSKIKVQLPSKDSPYHRVTNWINSIERVKPIEIFTTNYDLLIEQALEDTFVPYFDGFIGSKHSFFDLRVVEDDRLPNHWVRLWKIHGSLNWHRKPDGNITRSTGERSEWDNHLIYPSHLKYNESRKMPFLALIDRLSRFISNKASVIVISGYSFNDDHLNDCIVKALRANPTGIAFCLLYDDIEKYPRAKNLASSCPNLSLYAKDGAIIGTTEAKWKHSGNLDEVEASIKFLINDKAGQQQKITEFSIGDYDKFSLFLKYLISEDMGEKSHDK